jgi:hypothetical protein
MILKSFFALIPSFICVLNCFAQDSSVVLIPAGTLIADKLPLAKQFKYPEFRSGQVVFKDGSIAPAKLNYSYLSGEVEFIGPANDTLALSDDKTPLIKDISIDSSLFCFNKDYFEVIAGNRETGRILKRQVFYEMEREKIGAYGMPAPNSSVQSYGAVGSQASFRNNLVANENLYLKLSVTFFIESKKGEIVPFDKKNLLKIYSSKKAVINDYLDKNPVNFNREEDLKRLFQAINN